MKNKLLYIFTLFMLIFSLTACDMLVSEEALEIKSITTEVTDDGNTLFIITYTDDEIEPLVVTIPKPVEGNGISNIDYEVSDDSLKTNLIIKMTNGEEIKIPIPNGVSVTKTRYEDKDGIRYIYVMYSDGSESEGIPLQKGDSGADGLSIVSFKQEDITEGENIGGKKIIFEFSDGTNQNTYETEIIIPAPKKGDTGIGIQSITSFEDEEYYYLIVKYTDSNEDIFEFSRPKINKWITECRQPIATDGNDGDFFFDTLHKLIYIKDNGVWTQVVEFEDQSTDRHANVVLDLNDTTGTAYFETGKNTYPILKGSNFYNDGYDLPIPKMAGYKFMGWYSSKEPTIVNGMFTDLTTVTDDLKLFAKWELE